MDDLRAASGKSFSMKYGSGFSMDSLISAARKVAGLDKTNVGYAPGYCEENCYHLLDTLLEYNQASSLEELKVVWVSNRVKRVHLWCQKEAGIEEGGLCVKDYHVFVVQTPKPVDENDEPPSYVWDVDCTMPFPCRLSVYASNVLRTRVVQRYEQKFSRFFRVVPAATFIDQFASDRSHMLLSDDQGWIKPPPTWACIKSVNGDVSTIANYWDCYPPTQPWKQQPADSHWGLLMDEEEMLSYFNLNNY